MAAGMTATSYGRAGATVRYADAAKCRVRLMPVLVTIRCICSGIRVAGNHGWLRPVPAARRPRRNRPRPAGDGRDERFARIDLRAIAVSGLVLITVLIAAWLVEIARGHSGSPYYWLAAIGGLS